MVPWLTALIAAAVVAGCVASVPPGEFPPGALRLLPAEPAASVLYVALGDSTVEGVGASSPARNYVGRLHERLRAVYPRARLMNLGVGGATASGVLSRQLPRALELQPDLVTLSVGPNDITGKRDLESYARDIDAILRTLTRRTSAVVVVNLIPDLTVTPRFRARRSSRVCASAWSPSTRFWPVRRASTGRKSWTSTPRAIARCRAARISSGPTAIIRRTKGTRAGPN